MCLLSWSHHNKLKQAAIIIGYPSLSLPPLLCSADPCDSTLVAPMYGNISCHGDQVTGGFCTFTCQPGFSLMGSGRRECLSDHTWSGEDVYCQRKRCVDLAYSDAVVNELCQTTFESTCFITCAPGYFNPSPADNSVTCVVTSEDDNTVDWTTRPTCQGMDHFNHTYGHQDCLTIMFPCTIP